MPETNISLWTTVHVVTNHYILYISSYCTIITSTMGWKETQILMVLLTKTFYMTKITSTTINRKKRPKFSKQDFQIENPYRSVYLQKPLFYNTKIFFSIQINGQEKCLLFHLLADISKSYFHKNDKTFKRY